MLERWRGFLRKRKKKLWMFGFFGFFGCFGFSYFSTGDVSGLFFFSFFSFFASFFIGSLMVETPDERFVENTNKAAAKCMSVPTIFLFLVGWSASYPFGTKTLMVLLSAVGWAATFLTYAILLWYYERH
jgi:hypothetical protein